MVVHLGIKTPSLPREQETSSRLCLTIVGQGSFLYTVDMDLLFLFLFAHALGDFAFQSSHMVEMKHPKKNPESWYIYLSAHSVIHGGLVGFFSGSFLIAILETLCHFLIDFGKCQGKYGIHHDQLLHLACKGLWIILIAKGLA